MGIGGTLQAIHCKEAPTKLIGQGQTWHHRANSPRIGLSWICYSVCRTTITCNTALFYMWVHAHYGHCSFLYYVFVSMFFHWRDEWWINFLGLLGIYQPVLMTTHLLRVIVIQQVDWVFYMYIMTAFSGVEDSSSRFCMPSILICTIIGVCLHFCFTKEFFACMIWHILVVFCLALHFWICSSLVWYQDLMWGALRFGIYT